MEDWPPDMLFPEEGGEACCGCSTTSASWLPRSTRHTATAQTGSHGIRCDNFVAFLAPQTSKNFLKFPLTHSGFRVLELTHFRIMHYSGPPVPLDVRPVICDL
jgi:hypothetical protein